MPFVNLQALLLDQDVQMNASLIVTLSVNFVTTVEKNWSFDIKADYCQICTRKGHLTLNCYNRLNVKKFPPQYKCRLTASRASSNTPLVNTVTPPHDLISLQYPNFKVTTHITPTHGNVRHQQSPSDQLTILAANGNQMAISYTNTSKFTVGKHEFLVDDFLVVPSATKNLLSVHHLYSDHRVILEFSSLTMRLLV